MAEELVNWWEVFANAAVSFLVAVGVGLYIRFQVKPKHEKVFEHNRNEEIYRIFQTLQMADLHFGYVIDSIEENTGLITRDRDTIIPHPEFKQMPDGGQVAQITSQEIDMQRKFSELKPNLKYHHEQMEKISESFQKDYVRLLNHIESSFLGYIWSYIFDATYYAEWASKNYLMASLLDKRKNSADKITQFVKTDRTINQNEKLIKEFIDKWDF